MILEPHDLVCVTGIRGTGKSHWTRENIVAPASRVVTFDPHGEYPGARVTVDGLADVLDTPALRVSVVPEWRSLRQLADEFNALAELVALDCKSGGGGFVLVVEETGALTAYAREQVEFLACQSRHWRIPLVFVAQRAVQIPVTAREQASRIVAFRQIRPDDVTALRERIGDKADRVPRLPRRECVTWHEDEDFDNERGGKE